MGWLSSHLSHDLSMLGLRGHRGDYGGGDGMPFRYAMSPGDTVGGLARTLGFTVDALLGVNPGLRADTPLTPGMQLNLPAGAGQVPHDDGSEANRGQVPRDPPPGQNWHELPSAPALPRSFTVVLATSPQQVDVRLAGQPANDAGIATAGRAVPLAANPSAGNAAAVPAGYGVQLASGAGGAGSANGAGQALSYAQAAGLLMQAANSQRTDDRQLPPPPPMPPPSGTDRAPPVTQAMPLQGGWSVSPSASWSVVPVAAGNDEAKLQIMALLVAQLGGSMMASSSSMPQGPGFIDPQALAAQAASLRAGRVIDLGAGRSMQVSLVNDRLGRIDAIGREGQAATRRTGDGLDELRARQAEPDEEAAPTDEQREEGRRRRAAVAALRRRRRMHSVRCRYRRGLRLALCREGGRYPSGVDLAEFRSRQLPRYLWQRHQDGAADKGDRP
ncbi:hypothetical protein ASG87_17730 [Frateuria sp. Soil773]|uniref:LysM peptidoglycan-binding domain-containing protein n=1 Tax=Frateuria sp. Soil773 TaxID=1736407 RepID=UPI0006FF72F2|nr:LysM peptidoglycan-binding domain-containing protein [Frateuria sp. Soil773]KRE94444.1 hypothetical protein ASG87_17730 [Frateuria sp. Soil773]